ncbi:unnamed protein product [Anisakis simplex]|uniref:Uncharacterized protein n=1 Tax=Anisakis simplex TaxID=6269 RepID=A0A0M3JXC0_ANISI|nr:unnamed protein product [Anisakis simplex]
MMEICSHERKPLTDNTMLFFPEKVKFCATFYTSKRKGHYEKDVKRTANLHSLVKIAWNDIHSNETCTLFYKFPPDLGYYMGCQKAISLYISQLAAGKVPTWDEKNQNCPLHQLPNTYKNYLACDFVRGRWYSMSFESSIRYELYHNKAYRQFWSNHSSIYLIKPDYLLQRNGTEVDWLASLLTFRIRNEDHIHYTSLIANKTLSRWSSSIFAVTPSIDTQELCIEVSESNDDFDSKSNQ